MQIEIIKTVKSSKVNQNRSGSSQKKAVIKSLRREKISKIIELTTGFVWFVKIAGRPTNEYLICLSDSSKRVIIWIKRFQADQEIPYRKNCYINDYNQSTSLKPKPHQQQKHVKITPAKHISHLKCRKIQNSFQRSHISDFSIPRSNFLQTRKFIRIHDAREAKEVRRGQISKAEKWDGSLHFQAKYWQQLLTELDKLSTCVCILRPFRKTISER